MQYKKFRRIALKVLIGTISLILLCWIAVYVIFQIKKESIRKELSAEISNRIQGSFTTRDIGINFLSLFPNVSLSLKDVEIRDSTWDKHHKSFLKAGSIYLRVNPFYLISGNVRITKILMEDATINSFTDTLGFTNDYLFSPKSTPGQEKKGFHLEKIALKNVRFIRSDSSKNKAYDFSIAKLKGELDKTRDVMEIDVNLDAIVNSLAFDTRKGSYIKGKRIRGDFFLHFNQVQKALDFQNIKMQINEHPYVLSGLFNFLQNKFELAISTKKISYDKALAVLPAQLSKKLSRFSLDKTFDIKATIEGGLGYGALPKLSVESDITNGKVHTPAGDFLASTFKGRYYNSVNDSLPYTDENSQLLVNNLTTTWEGIPIKSERLTINNLANPFLSADLKAETKLTSLNELLNSSSFDFVSGKLDARGVYGTSLVKDSGTSFNGKLIIMNGALTYEPRQIKLDKIDGTLYFKGTDVELKDLEAEAQGNKVKINAVIKNMLELLMKDPSKLSLVAEVTSPSLDLYAFRTMMRTRKAKRKSTKGKFALLADKIDQFMDATSITTRLRASKLKYKNFNAENVDASIMMNTDNWNLKNISLSHGGGTIDLSGTLTSRKENYNEMTFDANMVNVDISKVFTSFNNFGLESLHAENLKGVLNANIHLSGVLDDESEMIPSLLNGTAHVIVRNGELIDFEPLQNMSVFVLKKRDFSRLEFAEIMNTFTINGSLITINKMEIQSNVLGFFLEGIYDVKGKNTDLVVQVPIKYLKKRDPSYTPHNAGVDAKKGISIYVRATNGANGQIDFKYGLFKKKSVLEKATTSTSGLNSNLSTNR